MKKFTIGMFEMYAAVVFVEYENISTDSYTRYDCELVTAFTTDMLELMVENKIEHIKENSSAKVLGWKYITSKSILSIALKVYNWEPVTYRQMNLLRAWYGKAISSLLRMQREMTGKRK